ncbi:MAG: GHKL domain-containing protein [Lachnospiraceae bacterium]|nr:GHKL domain-containing protein [Lachnospiraceae bacterium]
MEIGIRQVEALGNTPGLWYALSYFFSVIVFLSSNRKKQEGLSRLFLITGVGLLIVLFMVITDGTTGVWFVPIMLGVFTLLVLIFHLAMKGGLGKDIYYALRAFMLGEFMASLGWQLYYYGINNSSFKNNIYHQAAVMLPAIVIIFAVAFIMERHHKGENHDMDFNNQVVGGALAIVLSVYVFSNLSYVVTGTPFTTVYSPELFLIRTASDFMGVILLYVYHELMQQTAARLEERTLRNMLELQYSQYKLSEESIALVNQKYHDLKHQIAMLKTSISSKDRENGTEYLDQMLNEIRQYEAQWRTGNQVLDTMLSAEAMKCQASDIEFTCVADGKILSFMSPMDISALFGNALDNAIESAERISEKRERLIYLTVDRQRDFVRIYVENRYEGEVKFKHHLPQTTKKDKSLHGYGVKSMQQIAEKYGGSIRAEAVDGWFKLSILIPIPENSRQMNNK